MKRKCKELISSKDGKRAIYIDCENAAEIKKYITSDTRHEKKFKFIADIILGGHKNPDIYDKEEINEKCKGITAMKFFKGQENDRIYCKEIKGDAGVHIVIAGILHQKKKSTKLTQKEINLIETLAKYNYEI